MMPHYPRFSPSIGALDLKLPTQVAETATPAPDSSFLKRRPGRPKKIVDPNEPVKKRARKSQVKTAPDESTGTNEAGNGAEEGEVRKKRPYRRKAKEEEKESEESKLARLEEMLTQEKWGMGEGEGL